MKKAIVVGATGLVGRHLVRLLLESEGYAEVTTLVRRVSREEEEGGHDKLRQIVIDFDNMQEVAPHFRGKDALFCALGTTRAKAGSKEAFRKVDFTYAYEAAELAAEAGVQQFLLVSSVGADARSGNFYLSVKGELEEAVRQLSFPKVHIFRPSMLLGDRGEFRPLEVIGGGMMQLIAPLLGKYTPVEAQKVAQRMCAASLEEKADGEYFYASDEIKKYRA